MIPGLSGSLLSHDALDAAGLGVPESGDATVAQRSLLVWHGALSRVAGPAWTARRVFDEVAVPFCTTLGFQIVPVLSEVATASALLQSAGETVALLVALGWGRDLDAAWRDVVRRGIGTGVRWCFCFNGPAFRIFDARRTHSRRHVEFEVARIATDATTFAVTWRLLRATAFIETNQPRLERCRPRCPSFIAPTFEMPCSLASMTPSRD